MCIVNVVHKHDVLYNDLNPNNVMLHLPRDRDGAIFIGVCDWGMERGQTRKPRQTMEEILWKSW